MPHIPSYKQYWLDLKLHNPELYAEKFAEHRRINAKKIQQRTKDWKKDNRERYNAWRRENYKAKKEKRKAGQ